ncbi:alpha/beta hydrolase family esterase [Nocardia sp. NPDC052316]|uniref:alpha/beta hydrolase family esterase n=1 Tax=Nocardia sp. NPDC052316 TaxID=3364329 RepID=UPI0037C99615
MGLLAVLPPATAEAQAQCTLTPTGATITRTISSPVLTVGGLVVPGTRTYTVHVPPGLSGDVPLLIANHGFNATAHDMDAGTGWTQYAANHGFIVAYPQSIVEGTTGLSIPLVPQVFPGNVWLFNQNSIDVQYLKNVVADIEQTWCIDKTRVYATGHSEGSIMAQRMACDAADIFAAATSWQGADPTLPSANDLLGAFGSGGFGSVGATTVPVSPCTPSRPIAVGIFQGSADLYSNQPVGQENITKWTQRNGCKSTPVATDDAFGTLQTYSSCDAGITEIWRVMSGVPHGWPSGAGVTDLLDRQWNYLTNYTLP